MNKCQIKSQSMFVENLIMWIVNMSFFVQRNKAKDDAFGLSEDNVTCFPWVRLFRLYLTRKFDLQIQKDYIILKSILWLIGLTL